MSRSVPAHAPNCFGCGPENPAGLGLELDLTGDEVTGTITLDARHEGAPGLAHGGTIAAILDDAVGRLMYLTGLPAVTRRLEVDYLRRVEIGPPLTVHAQVGERSEGSLIAVAELTRADGRTLALGRAEMSYIDPDYFLTGAGAGKGKHAERTGLRVSSEPTEL